ncbi:MAG: biopolymer transporter ExbD [Azoarcus sp.]|jgi:biopolymer transport protein ExbD|nr:biopolymer transporter ExbD [Azoarcus sp.]
MAFGSFDSGASRPMVEINTTPLVDVMLVLLIIFLVTAPLMTQSVRVDLPQASAQTTDIKPETIRLALDAQGTLYWNDVPIAKEEEQNLESRLQAVIRLDPQTEVQFSADRETRYQRVAEIMATAKRAGVVKLGFITLPNN